MSLFEPEGDRLDDALGGRDEQAALPQGLNRGADTADGEYGVVASAQDLYREDDDDPWVSKIPRRLAELESEGSHDRFALVVRRQMQGGDEPGLAIHSIVVQSPFLRSVMQDTFRGYKGIATQLKQIVFKRPFHEFVYRWKDYQTRIRAAETDETARSHIKLFNAVIEPEILPHLERRAELLEHQIVSYPHLWMLFEPDVAVHTTINGYERVFQLKSSQYHVNSHFGLNCRFVNCDGERFGYENTTLQIFPFGGYMSIQDLHVKPIQYHADQKDLQSRLTARGKRFERFNGLHYSAYAGMALYRGPMTWEPENLESGRIVIDKNSFLVKNPHQMCTLEALDTSDSIPDSDDPDLEGDSLDEPVSDQAPRKYSVRHRHRRPPPPPRGPRAPKILSTSLDEHHYLFCTPVLDGYCLVTKRWARFFIDQVSPIKWSDAAFKRLILPHDYKELILAVVDGHSARATEFDDIIEGKGRGIIVLLHGDPGVGKTLTAEAVAEEIRRPLYSMSAGELGWDAGTVEQTLRDVLEICAKWKAVLLLDECDVFLEQRTTSDLQRNKLVSIFLRMLEYYKGVLFLTTNRVETFDRAFKSRIDLNINYPPLDVASRRRIWATFATASAEFPANASSLEGVDLDGFASLQLNGREIKNVVKTGRLLAQWKKQVLSAEHLRTALKVHNMAIED